MIRTVFSIIGAVAVVDFLSKYLLKFLDSRFGTDHKNLIFDVEPGEISG
ncbi:hypothetical protein SEA_NICEHOUSE_28 [Rhodococcus phage NiceHouse]|nr:hypothetical protein SEA_NICEHOUSE_28 [Rhodococcus phage NiceHouse]